MSYFSGRSVFITGAASGIGRQMALQLTAEGASVAALDCNAEALSSLEALVAMTRVADVTQAEEVLAAVAEAEARLARIDILIANAGVGFETSALDFQASAMKNVITVNLLGVANSIAAVLPGMLQRGGGHLVAISSLASFRGLPLMAGYCATKAGVNALMDGLRVELRDRNIHCTTICPGWIRTPMTAHIDLPLAGVLEPEVAVRHILDAIRRRRSFHAFPGPAARRVALLRALPLKVSDWLVARLYAKLNRS